MTLPSSVTVAKLKVEFWASGHFQQKCAELELLKRSTSVMLRPYSASERFATDDFGALTVVDLHRIVFSCRIFIPKIDL